MAGKSTEKRIVNLKKAMKKERGYMLPTWEYLAEKDTDFMEVYNNLYSRCLKDGRALPAKTREFIAIGILAYRGLTEAVYEHSKRALRMGATMSELLEAVETSMMPGGGPTLATGLRALMKIEEEQETAP